MRLPIDPETLRIPAFMRKRSLHRRLARPLVLTAFDRKKAGVLPEGLGKKKKSARQKSIQVKASVARSMRDAKKLRIENAEVNLWQTHQPVRRKKIVSAKSETFSPPLIDFFVANPEKPARTKSKIIGRISHYYEKIHVAVIELKAPLCVGDCITYETPDGDTYQQVIESMEVDREPIFKAGKGKEVGIKIRKTPRIGCSVIK